MKVFETKSGNKTEVKYMNINMEMKTVSDDGFFEGYAAVYGNKDLGGDIIEGKAFANYLSKNSGKVPILKGHWTDEQIGWNVEAREDEKGLFVKGQLNLNVQAGREQHALAKQAKEIGAEMGLSIGYMVKDSRDDHEKGVRYLKELELREYSLVGAFAMNQSATITNIKSVLDGKDCVNNVRDLEFLLKQGGFSKQEAIKYASIIKKSQSDSGENVDPSDSEKQKKDYAELGDAIISLTKKIKEC